MHCTQPVHSFDQDAPDLAFSEVYFAPFAIRDHFEKIAAISELHHQIERLGLIVNEGFFVGDYIGVLHAGQDPHLVNCILFVLARHHADLYFFESVDQAVLEPLHLVHARVGPISQLRHDLEVSQHRGSLVLHLVAVAEALLARLFL